MNYRAAILLAIPTLGISLAAFLRPMAVVRVPVTGTVFYRGDVASGDIINMSVDPFCASQQATAQATNRSVYTGANGGLQDVVVFVKTGIPPDPGSLSGEMPLLDQQGCMYRPRIVAMRTDQPLVIRNSDATLHNVHVYAEVNRGFNIGQPFQGVESQRRFSDQEIGIDVRCDIHGWMNGAIAVFSHSYFDVTTPDGQFSLDLPPGDYDIEAWHPQLGSSTQTVTVRAGEMTPLVFEF